MLGKILLAAAANLAVVLAPVAAEVGSVTSSCSPENEIVYLEGLILQGGDADFYLFRKGTCVTKPGKVAPTRDDLIELVCGDESWNYRQKERGTETEFRGLIFAAGPEDIVLTCHMPP